jgi:OOP family OmpA-OmpF porin
MHGSLARPPALGHGGEHNAQGARSSRRARSAPLRRKLGHALALAALVSRCAPRGARADGITSLALEPAPAGDPGLTVERATVNGEGLLSVRFLADIARRPLSVANRRGDLDNVVNSQIWLHTLVTYALASRLSLNLDLPAVLGQTEGDHPTSGRAAPGPDATSAIGDLRLGLRFSPLAAAQRTTRAYAVAVSAAVWLPTGRDAYASDSAFRAAASVLADGDVGRFYWSGKVGVAGRPAVRLGFSAPLRAGTAFTAGAAAGVYLDAAHALTLGPELALATTIVDATAFGAEGTVAHLLLGIQYLARRAPLEVGLGVGPDFARGPGSADYRVLIQVGMVPERALLRPIDSDGDAVTDDADACVRTPGVRSDDPERNGCPVVLDADSDHIADSDDACPNAFGDPSPERMLNGCPALAEPPGSRAELRREEIVIDQQIAFVSGSAVLLPESDPVLADVARVLALHPEIELLEVQGHTDERGGVDYNRKLSFERAKSVLDGLIHRGIAPERLAARGYGRERPLADNSTEAGMQKNRRVEFHVLRTSALPP